jgi:hypothetical protein
VVRPFIRHLDEGSLFKFAFVALYWVGAWGWLVGGLLSCLVGLVGDDGYFKRGVSAAEGMIDFVLGQATPRLISTWGEVMFVLAALGGSLMIVAALVGSAAYFPFGAILRDLGGEVARNLLRPLGGGVVIRTSYDQFAETFAAGGVSIFGGFLVLTGAYLARELWTYGMKVLTAFVRFLPRFALNIRVRTLGAQED